MQVISRTATFGLPLAAAGCLLVPMAGCSHNPQLVPAASVKQDHTAMASSAGVTVEAAGKWSGVPSNLPKVLTPVRATVTNRSGVPILVRYRDFDLHVSTGATFPALPPFQIRGTITESVPVTAPAFAYSGFAIAPYYSGFYPGFGVWGGPFYYDWPYYTTYWAEWPVNLPTQDMIQQAIPEGVLDNGGEISGYLYFHRIPKNAEAADLYVKLINARTSAQFGVIGIPFLVKQ
jgi:hypothetical protein